jgi:cytochrome c peroxidase
MRRLIPLIFSISLLAAITSFAAFDARNAVPGITPAMLDKMTELPGGLGALPAVPVPADNPQTPAKIELGKRLFFDTRLSRDLKSSCATCHSPEKAFSDGLARARGFQDAILRRRSPSVLNAAYNRFQFWDGRAASLDEQCKGPLLSPMELNMIDEKHLVDRLNHVAAYRRDFQRAFSSGPSLDNVAMAISAFERTLVTPDSRFDRYSKGDKTALTDSEKRGLIVYFGKGSCSQCHKGANFTDDEFHNLGQMPGSGAPKDLGRFEITKDAKDKGAFKTPSLRNVALRAPYMHDGSFATLQEVIDFYDRGGDDATNRSKLIFKLSLTDQEKSDLLAFLKTLNGTIPQVIVPEMYADDAAGQSKGNRP